MSEVSGARSAMLESLTPAQAERLAPLVVAAHARSQAAWPTVTLDLPRFAAHVAARLDPTREVVEEIGRLACEDLYLACACAHGDSRAISVLEQAFARPIAAALRRIRNGHMLPDDFRQTLRHKLFVADGDGAGAIARYSGHGRLAAWLRVTALRAALNATRNRAPIDAPVADDDLFEFAPSPEDAELEHIKRGFQQQFRAAFLATLDELDPQERTLLRHRVVHGLGVREIASLVGVNHATVSRHLARARTRLLEGTRRLLAERLRVDGPELDSIMAMVQSRLDVSVARVLSERS